MYALFVNNNFRNFWGNTPGDIFLERTMQVLNLSSSEVELHYYPALDSVPANYRFTQTRILEVLNSYQKEVDGVTVTEEDVVSAIEPITYFANGLYLKPC